MLSVSRRHISLWTPILYSLTAFSLVACASSRPPNSEYSANVSGALEPKGSGYELGSFSSVRAGEIATPIAEAAPDFALSASDAGSPPRQGGCHLGHNVVEHSIRRHLPAIRACYERESRGEPQLAGKVTVSFVIQPNGQVRSAEAIENSTGSEAVAACVSRGVRRIHFAAGRARGTVSCVYPFLFGARR